MYYMCTICVVYVYYVCTMYVQEGGGALCVEELGPDARVDGVGHLLDVRTRGLAQRGERVHGRDALRQHGVRGQLRQLRGPPDASQPSKRNYKFMPQK